MIATHTLSDVRITLPSWEELLHVLLLEEYNTRVVVLGVMALGLASGLIGTFLVLRKRALTADALSHATLPGIVIAFLFMVGFGGDGKSLIGLLIGAFVFGCIGVLLIVAIRSTTRLKDDAAIGIVLSVLFGLGICLLRLATDLPSGNSAGLSGFIFGKASSMVASDAMIMVSLAVFVSICTAFLFKEFTVLCFDSSFGSSQGWPILLLDTILMTLVAIVTVIALQTVGLVLAVALLIIPAASARFWTNSVKKMLISAAIIGVLSGWLGAVVSAVIPRIPTGPIIVMICGFWFLFSLVFGADTGILKRQVQRLKLNRKVELQHLLRAMYELIEGIEKEGVSIEAIVSKRSWSNSHVNAIMKRAKAGGYIDSEIATQVELTVFGHSEAERMVRNHRLWEVYLINYADIAPSHVDRDADMIEHVLGTEMVNQLESLLAQDQIIDSPHPIGGNP
ncbi:MAG: iron chelate uptake ABC transporter family permease subunit [Planctomycetota bacterium]|nr:iron chelate uptake ABC transporter family permease subunit [Planctomycetota bacterium]